MSKIAIITGASRGIGYQTATKFLAEKWQVINLSRHECTLDNVINIQVDLCQSDHLLSIIDQLKPSLSRASKMSLIHNAAACPSDSIRTIEPTIIRHVMELNVIAPALLTQTFLPYMSKGSSIIYIGSTLSEIAVRNTVSYVTSKHAVAGLMKATCQDLESSGIHTCCICPGLTDTQMLHERAHHDQALITELGNLSSFKRLVKPEEIAELIWFCANNPVINGAILHANLGQIAR